MADWAAGLGDVAGAVSVAPLAAVEGVRTLEVAEAVAAAGVGSDAAGVADFAAPVAGAAAVVGAWGGDIQIPDSDASSAGCAHDPEVALVFTGAGLEPESEVDAGERDASAARLEPESDVDVDGLGAGELEDEAALELAAAGFEAAPATCGTSVGAAGFDVSVGDEAAAPGPCGEALTCPGVAPDDVGAEAPPPAKSVSNGPSGSSN